MKDRPIIFSGPMVRAILEGRKSQTRRVVKPQPEGEPGKLSDWSRGIARTCGDTRPDEEKLAKHTEGLRGRIFPFVRPSDSRLYSPRCPYGAPGDRLWVRETWQFVDETGEADKSESLRNRLGKTAPFRGVQGDRPITWRAVYRADGEASHPQYGPIVWRPSIHMPRWASRLTLEIKAVRVERLQEISEEDARAEGVIPLQMDHGLYRPSFEGLWDSINAKRGYGWDANPWVWVIEFARVEPV